MHRASSANSIEGHACTMLATCFLLSSRTELSACCAMHTSLNVSKPLGRSVKNLHSYTQFSLLEFAQPVSTAFIPQ